MENVLTLTLLLLLAELFEALMQRSPTLLGVLEKLYSYYHKSIFLFFMMQPGFYVLVLISLLTGVLNFTMIFLLAIKIFDMFYKMELIKKVFIEQQVSKEMAEFLAKQFSKIDKRFLQSDASRDARFDFLENRLTKVELGNEETRHDLQGVAEGLTSLRSEMRKGFDDVRTEMREGSQTQAEVIRDLSARMDSWEARSL